MTEYADALIEAFLADPDLSKVQHLVAQAPRTRVVRRCSVPRQFDRKLYESVLAKGIDGAPAFDTLVTWPEVVVRSRTELTYAVADRARMLQEWRRELSPTPSDSVLPQQIADVDRALAEHYQGVGEAADVERIYHLLAFDFTAAHDLLKRLYKNADEAFDLAACQELLLLASERYTLLPPEVKSFVDDRRAYLEARSLWMDEYLKSRLYLPRDHVREFLDGLLDGEAWIGDLSGAGGMGKTAAIRWHIAYCSVPEPRRVPVARIDFDFLTPQAVMADPTHLLKVVADQMDPQIAGRPFSDIRGELAKYGNAVAVAGSAQVESYDTRQTDRFARLLRSARKTKPVLIVFDTVEVAMFSTSKFEGLLKLLEQIHRIAPSLRVLFSGRFPMTEKVPAVARFGSDLVPLIIKQFEDDESRRYLKEKRRIADDALVESIVRKARGVPFKLMLYGDIVAVTPLTAADIDKYADVDVIYLIRRIVRRLSNPQLRWVLRYGVVPRRLTLAFLRDVMAGFLPDAMSGASRDDDPGLGLPDDDSDAFERSAKLAANVDVEKLWEELWAYAGEHSWVSQDRQYPETLSFHVEVVEPMRRLLRRNRVFRKLHQRAIRHYDALANDTDDFAATREAIYHRFQLGTRDAASYWRATVRRALETNPEAALELAEELTLHYFANGEPLVDDEGLPLIDPILLGDAFLVQAQTQVRVARKSGDREAWLAASTPASSAEHCYQTAGREAPLDVALIHAAIALETGNIAAAEDALGTSEGSTAAERVALGLVRAEIALTRGAVNDVVLELREADRLLRPNLFGLGNKSRVLADRDQRDVEAFIAVTLAEYSARIGRFDEASAVLKKHRGRVKNPDDVAAMDWAEARLLVRRVLPAQAVRTLPRASRQATPAGARMTLTVAEALRIREHPQRALALCEQMLQNVREPAIRAEATQLRATILTDLLEHAGARVAYEEAIAAWRELGQGERLADCLEAGARAELTRLGNISVAEDFAATMERGSNSQRERFRLLLLRAEISAARGKRVRRELQAAEEHAQTAVEVLRVAVTGLRLDDKRHHDRYAKTLASALGDIEPPTARVALLAPLRYCRPLALTRSRVDSIVRLLPRPRFAGDYGVKHDEDRILLGVRLANELATLGRRRTAGEVVQWCALKCASAFAPLLAHELNVAAGRAEIAPPLQRTVHQWRKAIGAHQNLLALVLVEEAEALRGLNKDMIQELTEAAREAAKEGETAAMLAPRIATARKAAESALRPRRKTVKRVARRLAFAEPRLAFASPRPAAMSAPPTSRPTIHFREGSGLLVALVGNQEYRVKRARPPFESPYQFAIAYDEQPASAKLDLTRYLFEGLPLYVREMFTDVALEFERGSHHSFPWELGLRWGLGSHQIRHVYRTRSRMWRPREPDDTLDVSRVLVVHSTVEEQRAAYRGALVSGRSVDEFYARFTPWVQTITDASFGAFERAVAELRPGLIHLSGSMTESGRSGGVHLQFGDGTQWGGSGLMKILYSGARNRPLIIVDPARPPERSELLYHLTLRNLFAAELFEADVVRAVLGTGFFAPESQDVAYDILASEMSAVRTLGDLVERFRRAYPGDDVSTDGIALFSSSPETRLRIG